MKERKYTRNNTHISYVLGKENEVLRVVIPNNASDTCSKCNKPVTEQELDNSIAEWNSILCTNCNNKLTKEYNDWCDEHHNTEHPYVYDIK